MVFIAARVLRSAGWTVRLGLLGALDNLRGDTALAASRWGGPVEAVSEALLEDAGLAVDALFGAGLNRDLDGKAKAIVEAMQGRASTEALTVTFFRAKPGHLLLPGREFCSDLRVVDIGIPESTLDSIARTQGRNRPAAWIDALPVPRPSDHKYKRGRTVIVAGSEMIGAAQLAAQAARRAGAGLLTIAAPAKVVGNFRTATPGVLVFDCDGSEEFSDGLRDPRQNAILVRPGLGLGARTRRYVEAALATGRAVVLDADALTMFDGLFEELAFRIGGPLVISPHDGEFARLFPDLLNLGKLERVKEAAERLGGVVVLKGAYTVIAEPGGNALINGNAPPWLATGRTGDVLVGTILGLLAQGMPVFEAAAAPVWLNEPAASSAGFGLLAEDLPGRLLLATKSARQQETARLARGD